MSGIAGGAEAIVIPERELTPEQVASEIRTAYERGKLHAMIVVAEGAKNNMDELEAFFKVHKERLGFEIRITRLGHVQRGGMPGAFDRLLATRLGAAATRCLAEGEHNVLVGLKQGDILTTPLAEVVANKKQLDLSLFDLVADLSR